MTQEAPIEEIESQAELSNEQKRARRRALAQMAVALASQGRWEEALKVNGQILEMFPDDPEANNRVGNALKELGRIPEAIEAYEASVNAQPTNMIAQRNLERLRQIADVGEVAARPSQKLASSFFIEEVGKTGMVDLVDPAPTETLLLVTPGEEVAVREHDSTLEIASLEGTYLGKLDEALAERLARLMTGGNRYQAGVVMVDGSHLRILIREVYQSPEQEGRISFPPRSAAEVRGYTRETLIRRAGEDDEEGETEPGDVEAEEADDEDENPAEFGFSETTLPGSNES